MRKSIHLGALAAVALVMVPPAQSGIISGEITFKSDTSAIFDKSSLTTVGRDSIGSANLYAFREGYISNEYASHYIAYDPIVRSRINADITFGGDIVAVIHSSSGLDKTDLLFDGNGITYNYAVKNSLENRYFFSYDSYTVSGDTISVALRASSPGDYLRVITTLSEDESAGSTEEPGKTLEDVLLTDLNLGALEDVTFIEPQIGTSLVVGTSLALETLVSSIAPAQFTIPEPTTLALVGLGLAGIGYRRRPGKAA